MRNDVRLYAAEFIGTAFIVFCAAGSVMITAILGNLPGPLISGAASGIIVTVMVWALYDVSGAHFNPALTVSLAVFDGFPLRLVPGYIIAQLMGSALAGALLYVSLGPQASMGANLPNTALGISPSNAFVIECVLSFLMMLVIRGAFSASAPLRQFAAVPIGATVGMEVMLLGPIAGAAMNPARAFGPYLFHGQWQYFWIYAGGPLVGILAAGLVWKLMRPVPPVVVVTSPQSVS